MKITIELASVSEFERVMAVLTTLGLPSVSVLSPKKARRKPSNWEIGDKTLQRRCSAMAMKFILFSALIGVAFASCTNQNDEGIKMQTKDSLTIKKTINVQNLVSIIEIPTSDLKRAITFYKSILTVNIEEAEMGDVKMGILPSEEGTVNVVLANGKDYKPTTNGSVLYLNGGENLQTILDKVEPNGGQIIVPKTEISPEMGYFALFIDTEGNKMGLHSAK